jgi:putative ABC transport system permease protein
VLVVAVLGFFGSLNGSVDAFTDDIAGVADLEIAAVSDAGFNEEVFFEVSETEGVEAAVPMIRTPALVEDRRAIILGFDQKAEALGTRIVSEEEALRLQERAERPGVFMAGSFAEETGLSEGDSVRIFSSAGAQELEVLAVIGGEAARFNQGRFVGAFLPLAQQIAGKVGRLDAIMVLARDDADLAGLSRRLERRIGSAAVVQSLDQRAEQARLATRNIQVSMLMGVAMALIVGAFLIFNTMNMAATERRRELATLRALGGRRRPLLISFLLEAGLLGLIGSALGSVLGVLIARRLIESIPTFLVSAVGVELGFYLPVYAVPAALVAGALISMVAAYLPARRAVRVAPVDSMRPEGALESIDAGRGVSAVPTALGLAMLIGGTSLALYGPAEFSFIWVGAALSGVLVATFGLTSPITRATAALAGRVGAGGRLAASALERAPRRAWATTAAVVVATGMVVAQTGITRNLTDSLRSVVGSLGEVDLYVSSSDGSAFPEVELPGDWTNELRAIPGVADVGTNSFQFINFRDQKVLVQGLEGRSMARAAPALVGTTAEIGEQIESGDGAVLSTRFSDLYGVKKGDTLELPTPNGPRRLEVIHVAPQFIWERGMVSVGRKVMRESFGLDGVTDYGLALENGADPVRVQEAVQEFVSLAPLPVFVYTGADQLATIFETAEQISSLFTAMTAVVVGAAMLAIFNALLISVVERRRELGIMRAIGTSRRQLRRMVGIEAAALGLVGGVIGTLVGFLLHRAAISAIAQPSGYPLRYEFVPEPAAVAFAVGAAIAVLGSLFPARRAASVNIIEAIGYE